MANDERPQGVSPSDLSAFCASLEDTETTANGYGELKSAVVETELDGVKVVGTYYDRGWLVSFPKD